jgi:hypothetical protein
MTTENDRAKDESLLSAWESAIYDPWERVIDEHETHRLISNVREICLSGDQPPSTAHRNDFQNSPPLPGRGIQTALRPRIYAVEADLDCDDEPPRPYDMVQVRFPNLFSESPNPDIIREIRNLGEDFLAEAWRVLGDDVAERIAEIANTPKSDSKFIQLIEKNIRFAITRLYEITLKNADPDTPPGYYHPARLSPKLIGRYPDTQLDPTCLSKTIIMASFLRQCGIETVFAGVMESKKDNLFTQARQAMESILDDIPLDCRSSAHEETRHTIGRSMILADEVAWALGYHAAVYAEVGDQQWMMIDPTYNQVRLMSASDNQAISRAQQDISDLYNQTAGLSLAVPLSAIKHNYRDEIIELNQECDIPYPTLDEIDEFLQNMNDHEVPQQILRRFLKPCAAASLTSVGDSQLRQSVNDSILHDSNSDINEEKEEEDPGLSLLSYIFSKLYNDASEFVQRCQIDESYRRARAKDILMFCHVMRLNFATAYATHMEHELFYGSDSTTESFNRASGEHVLIEVGEIAEQIGLSVINHFVGYCDTDISPKALLSYWTSDIAVIEPRALDQFDQTFSSAQSYNLGALVVRPFQYYCNSDIIHSVLRNNVRVDTRRGGD